MLVVCLYSKRGLLNLVKDFCVSGKRMEDCLNLTSDFRLQYLVLLAFSSKVISATSANLPNYATVLYDRQIEVHFPEETEILCFAQSSGKI